MQFFIAVGIILFMALFVLMSLPIDADKMRGETEPKTQQPMLD